MITGGRPIIVSGTAPNYKGGAPTKPLEVEFASLSQGTPSASTRTSRTQKTRVKHFTLKNLGAVNLEVSFDRQAWFIIRPTDPPFSEWVSVHHFFVRADGGVADFSGIGIEA